MNTSDNWAFEKSFDSWGNFFSGIGEQPYRASQICAWLWKRRVFEPALMTDFSLDMRGKLNSMIDFTPPKITKEERASDGTRKFLIEMRDGACVEAALLKHGERLTACISSQVGCPVGCPFCHTGSGGFERNLTAGEICGQFLAIEKHLEKEVNNIVFMGMGEPFLNTEALLEAVRMLNHQNMRCLGIRHMTVSTAGVIPGIRALAESGLGIGLAVSLHASDDELRDELVPCNLTYPLKELILEIKEYQRITGDRVTIEYALFKDKNDTLEHARQLVRLLHGIHAYINLIPANTNNGGYERSTPETSLRFQSVLKSAGFESEIRIERGGDINAACGQLKSQRDESETQPPMKKRSSASFKKQNPEKRGPQNITGEKTVRGNSGKYRKKPDELKSKRYHSASGSTGTIISDSSAEKRTAGAARTQPKRISDRTAAQDSKAFVSGVDKIREKAKNAPGNRSRTYAKAEPDKSGLSDFEKPNYRRADGATAKPSKSRAAEVSLDQSGADKRAHFSDRPRAGGKQAERIDRGKSQGMDRARTGKPPISKSARPRTRRTEK